MNEEKCIVDRANIFSSNITVQLKNREDCYVGWDICLKARRALHLYALLFSLYIPLSFYIFFLHQYYLYDYS
jgi:hypothetical protein